MSRRPELSILMAAVLFSTGGAAIKGCSFGPTHVAGLRALVAAMLLFALLPASRRLPARALPLLPAWFGATYLFVLANKLTTAANAIFLQSTAPFWVMVLGPALLGERARRADLLALVGIAIGMTLFFAGAEATSATAPDPGAGDLIALASGMAFGLLLLGFRWLGRRGQGEQASVVAWGSLLLAAAVIAFAGVPHGSVRDWLVIVYLGLLQVGLAYVLLVRAITQVPALRASLLLMLEPALNPVWAFLVHGERPGLLPLCGGALIVGAVASGSLRGRAVPAGGGGAPADPGAS